MARRLTSPYQLALHTVLFTTPQSEKPLPTRNFQTVPSNPDDYGTVLPLTILTTDEKPPGDNIKHRRLRNRSPLDHPHHRHQLAVPRPQNVNICQRRHPANARHNGSTSLSKPQLLVQVSLPVSRSAEVAGENAGHGSGNSGGSGNGTNPPAVRLSREEAREAAKRDLATLEGKIPQAYHDGAAARETAATLCLTMATYRYMVDLKKDYDIPLHGHVVVRLSDKTLSDKFSTDRSERRRKERRYYHMIRNALPLVYRASMDDLELPDLANKALITALEFIEDVTTGKLALPVLYD
ncbi:hypothetical protein PVAG01_09465 [Phlyctema vagabunda]|uniref:Uncharacterized protein n=1 Tax=Phlyctema vagabunda TaxID=108571 RepID=A0ABR4P7G6_9HELO